MFQKRIGLRSLLIILSVGSVTLTSLLLLTALWIIQKENIEDSLLSSNIAYARKLADTTDGYFSTAQRELAYSAQQIKTLSDEDKLHAETERLRLQSGFFNSVVIVNAKAVIAATSPESLSPSKNPLFPVPLFLLPETMWCLFPSPFLMIRVTILDLWAALSI
jgi:hypothetical protein